MNASWLDFLPVFWQGLLVTTGIGLIIGLEREHQQQKEPHHFAGLRTFPLIALLGFATAYISDQYAPLLLPAVALGAIGLIAFAYFVQARDGDYGLTTEIALATVFILGVVVAYGHPAEALAISVVTTVLLSLKEEFHRFVRQISTVELAAFIRFFVLAILLLLLLPDRRFGPDDILHYRDLGWVIILISFISFAGYLLLKFTDSRRGILLTALLGGLFSSTMIAWIFAARSRQTPELSRPLGAGILLSSSIMYIRVLLISAMFHFPVTRHLLLPCLLMLMVSLTAVWSILRGWTEKEASAPIPLGNPLDLKNALGFGLLYVAVTMFMYYSRVWFGESGSYWSGVISGIADMDAITISATKWAEQTAAEDYAANLIIIAALSNTVFKCTFAVIRGEASIRKYLALGFGLVLIVGFLWLGTRLFF